MGKVLDAITPEIEAWIGKQRMFFVATAPLAATGSVNVSPKGIDSFRVLSPNEVGYLDLTGSGIETVAHLRENGRIVVMFCAFEGPPKIVRLHGRGNVTLASDPGYSEIATRFPTIVGARSIIRVTIERVSDSCGYGVPKYDFVEQRDTLIQWAEKKDAAAIAKYLRDKNANSIDGLPGLDPAPDPRDAVRAELGAQLARVPEWQLVSLPEMTKDSRAVVELHRSYGFASFGDAIEFMGKARAVIDRLDHHPRWQNTYKTVAVWLTTHDAGDRPTERDVELAAMLDDLARELAPRG